MKTYSCVGGWATSLLHSGRRDHRLSSIPHKTGVFSPHRQLLGLGQLFQLFKREPKTWKLSKVCIHSYFYINILNYNFYQKIYYIYIYISYIIFTCRLTWPFKRGPQTLMPRAAPSIRHLQEALLRLKGFFDPKSLRSVTWKCRGM